MVGKAIFIIIRAVGFASGLWSLWQLYNSGNRYYAIGFFLLALVLVIASDNWERKREIQKEVKREIKKAYPDYSADNKEDLKSHTILTTIYNIVSVIISIAFVIIYMNQADKPYSFEGWWNDTINSSAVVCMLPFNAKEPVYPTAALSEEERKQSAHFNAYINNHDEINIVSIERKPNSNTFSAYINYPINGEDKRANGYLSLKNILDINVKESIKELITNQTTRVYIQPESNRTIPNLTHIKPREKIYLLGTCNDWQQILYNYKYHSWYICWVKKEELVSAQTCTVKEPLVHVRESPEESITSMTTIHKGEVYTIREVKKAKNKTDWYKIYANGTAGWISSGKVTVDGQK